MEKLLVSCIDDDNNIIYIQGGCIAASKDLSKAPALALAALVVFFRFSSPTVNYG